MNLGVEVAVSRDRPTAHSGLGDRVRLRLKKIYIYKIKTATVLFPHCTQSFHYIREAKVYVSKQKTFSLRAREERNNAVIENNKGSPV